MFKKILIANRGEIACRVIRTARLMGIKTVAVYSEADAGALHTQMADEAVVIGPAPAAESYLVIERILDAISRTDADAVHPGYGFLSENGTFADALSAAGVAFIGPGPKAIAAMGDKIESKKLARDAGVNMVPGHLAAIADADEAAAVAAEIGYPVMLKASAGGGGKGMRIAYDEAQAREGFVSAANEARSSFADDRVFVEKFIEQPRHIEIQVLADGHGNCIYLGERECSIQRRHQKVIEEAPSPFLDPQTRQAMGEQAVALAKAVDYQSAGTVEFIVDADKNFYFLEMNTRLQVEHPVTEMVTGVDLVEQMIRVAAGETLSITQSDVALNGWAIEARVYAEDPTRNFMPSIGRLRRLTTPAEGSGVRVDTGVVEGSEISMFYDPMIAKLIAHGDDRDAAIARMSEALDGYYIRGINHNVSFLNALVRHPRFREGRLTTAFLDEEFPDGFQNAPLTKDIRDAMAAAAVLVHLRLGIQATAGDRESATRRRSGPIDLAIGLDGESHAVSADLNEAGLKLNLSDRAVEMHSDWRPGQPLLHGSLGGASVTLQLDMRPDSYRLIHAGVTLDVTVRTPRAAELARLMPKKEPPDLSKLLRCPMPGLVISIDASVGDNVKAGQALAVVEAMKMENVLRAEQDGTIAAVHVSQGESLAVDQVILEFA